MHFSFLVDVDSVRNEDRVGFVVQLLLSQPLENAVCMFPLILMQGRIVFVNCEAVNLSVFVREENILFFIV